MIGIQTNQYRGHVVTLNSGIQIIFPVGQLEKVILKGMQTEQTED